MALMRPFGAQSSPSTSCRDIKDLCKTPLPCPEAPTVPVTQRPALAGASGPEVSRVETDASHWRTPGGAGSVRGLWRCPGASLWQTRGTGGEGGRSEDSQREEGNEEEEEEANRRAPEKFIGLKVSFAVASPLRAELCLACAASGKSVAVISLGASHGT